MTGVRLAGAMLIVAGFSGPVLADDSCYTALNNRCEEAIVGLGYCAPATDSSDCADASILPGSSMRLLDQFDVRYLDAAGLRLARNEIFARHDYRFNSQDLLDFFGRRSWYQPVDQTVTLTEVEQANVDYLRQVEDGSIDPAEPHILPPDGVRPPPWAAWQADMVHADGRVDRAFVDGVRGRVVEADSGRIVIVRPDREDALYIFPGDEFAVTVWWGLFPPVLAEPYILGLGIAPQPVGREMMLGEKVTRVRLDWEDVDGYATLHGEAWVTDDGIFLQVALDGTFTECCGGDEGIAWALHYRLENLQRSRPDPALLEPPPGMQWSYAG